MKLVRFALAAFLAATAVACGSATPQARARDATSGNEVGTTTITSALTDDATTIGRRARSTPTLSPFESIEESATPKVGKTYRSKPSAEDLLEPKHVSREGKKSLGFGGAK